MVTTNIPGIASSTNTALTRRHPWLGADNTSSSKPKLSIRDFATSSSRSLISYKPIVWTSPVRWAV